MDKATQRQLFDILYALAARDGRDGRLFGDDFPLMRAAFAHSLSCGTFPEVWFELPLAGEPWCDVHVLVARESLLPGQTFSVEDTGGYPELFAWFAQQGEPAAQLALSYDVSRGDVDRPAVQLRVSTHAPHMTADFFAAAGRADAIPAYQAFLDRNPESWFACYAGLFPGRALDMVRVECIVDDDAKQRYADDPAHMVADLRRVGVTALSDEVIEQCAVLVRTPFQFEFQFDVLPDGSTGDTFAASVRFAMPSAGDELRCFQAHGAAGDLLRQIESWGLADDRWRLFEDAIVCVRASRGDVGSVLYNYPTFVKLRWRDGEPLDAKAYFLAGIE